MATTVQPLWQRNVGVCTCFGTWDICISFESVFVFLRCLGLQRLLCPRSMFFVNAFKSSTRLTGKHHMQKPADNPHRRALLHGAPYQGGAW